MKKTIVVLLIVWMCTLLAGCESTVRHPESPSVPANTDVPSTAVPLSDNEDTGNPDEYVLSYPISVGNSRELTLKLHGKKLSEEYDHYGICTVEVFDGNDIIQTIQTQEAISSEWDAGGEEYGGYTEAYTQDGGLTTTDMSFDGSGDIGLVGWITSGANIPYYYWLWEEDQGQFTYSFYLCNAVVDEENKQLISTMRNGAAEYDTNYYQYDTDGRLQIVKRIVEIYGGEDVITETYELVNGELQKVE